MVGCPFCGGTELTTERQPHSDKFSVVCDGCGAEGPPGADLQRAAVVWVTRADPPNHPSPDQRHRRIRAAGALLDMASSLLIAAKNEMPSEVLEQATVAGSAALLMLITDGLSTVDLAQVSVTVADAEGPLTTS